MLQRIPRVANRKPPVTKSSALLMGLAFVNFVAHTLVSSNYGCFRDELYYIEAGRHLAFGYVDFPPLIALVAPLRLGGALMTWARLLASSKQPQK